MPNRIIKESARTSPTLDALSAGAERMFWRLVTAADDYGRFDADPRVLLAQCFPLKVHILHVDEIAAWIDEMTAVDLIRLYEAKGRTFGYFPAWTDHQRPARSKSKHPAPPRKPQPLDVVVGAPSDHNPPPIVSNPPQSATIRRDIVSRDSLSTESRDSLRAGDDGNKPSVTYTPQGFLVSEELLAMWARAYPALDIQGEVHRAHAWTLANPANSKSNWHRFLVGWLKREQDRAPRRTMQTSANGASSAPSQGRPVPIRPAILDEPDIITPERAAANANRAREMVASLAGTLPKVRTGGSL